jgi:hypothetical protein
MAQQLALYRSSSSTQSRTAFLPAPLGRPLGRSIPTPGHRPLCAGCRDKEARYGFRNEEDPTAARPRTLCFDCFRVEVGRRQAVAARMARGWNATQTSLPLADTLQRLDLRRRRAQIAARHALGL